MTQSKEMGKSVEFAASTEISVKSDQERQPSKQPSRRRSSFFKNLSKSFRRSSGERGADVETLRGTHGPDFEGYATINRPDGGVIGCGCFGTSKDTKERLLLIKGPFLFVFSKEADKAPKYAVSLAHMKAKARAPSHGQTMVTLETNLGDIEYEISFESEDIAKQFAEVSIQQAAVGEAEEVRKRLGHAHLLNKGKSVRYAEAVALKKVEDQPAKPEAITAADMEQMAPMGGL